VAGGDAGSPASDLCLLGCEGRALVRSIPARCGVRRYNHLVLARSQIQEVFPLAACSRLAENSRLGFQPVASTSQWGSGFSISSSTLGLSASLYDGRVRPRSTGKERDSESGNDYFGARYYASSMGRFMSPDWSAKQEPVPYAKLDNPQSLNLYAYVLNNPLTHVDPDGHDCHTFLGITVCFGKPAPLPPPPPTPKPPPVPPPPPLKFKPNVPVPAPNSNLGKLLQCTNNCMNPVPIGVSSTSETVPGHPEIHGPDTPHGRGEAADLTPGKSEAKPTLWCSAQCGAGFGQNEYDHPSAHATGAHDHVQTGEGRGGSRGDLPANEHPEQPQE
jgi:RHS repeat-associated protein